MSVKLGGLFNIAQPAWRTILNRSLQEWSSTQDIVVKKMCDHAHLATDGIHFMIIGENGGNGNAGSSNSHFKSVSIGTGPTTSSRRRRKRDLEAEEFLHPSCWEQSAINEELRVELVSDAAWITNKGVEAIVDNLLLADMVCGRAKVEQQHHQQYLDCILDTIATVFIVKGGFTTRRRIIYATPP